MFLDVGADGNAVCEAMPRTSDVKVVFHRWRAGRPNGPFTDPIDLGTIRADGSAIVLRLATR